MLNSVSTEKNKGIYWLASYPKSGNTWVRVFIASMLSSDDQPVNINGLNTGAIASSYEWVEKGLGFEISELSQDEIDRLRQQAYRWHSENMANLEYHKVHDAYTWLPDGSPLFPPEATRGVLYVVRNPLDVAISFAHHNSCDIDQAVKRMGNHEGMYGKNPRKMHMQLRQKLLSWSGHVNSWLSAENIDRLIVRYEDMLLAPETTFSTIADFLQLPGGKTEIMHALDQCSFKNLKKQEMENGFNEKMQDAKSFFRKGVVGDWEVTLTRKQIKTIVDTHAQVMRRFGYLDGKLTPIRRDAFEENYQHCVVRLESNQVFQ